MQARASRDRRAHVGGRARGLHRRRPGRSSTGSSRRSPRRARWTTSSRSSRPRSAPAGRAEGDPGPAPTTGRRRPGRRRAGAVLSPLGDILFGRKKLKEPAAERLFALSTAAVTLQTECSLTPAGDSALIFKPLSAGEFTSTENDAEELLRSVAQGQGSDDRPQDRLVRLRVGDRPRPAARRPGRRRPRARVGARGARLRRPAPRRRVQVRRQRSARHPVYWIYGFKTGTWWPFVPTGEKQERDNAHELELKAKLEKELPVEPTSASGSACSTRRSRRRACPSRGRSPRGRRGASRAAGDP